MSPRSQHRGSTGGELAQLLAELGVAATLLARHTADQRGDCRGCAQPQGGPVKWPCSLFSLAHPATLRASLAAPVATLRP